ncbi:histidine kinase CKI1 [Cajanus cajan]|uniref:histidine kinase CKI1 n=1 Tax=Cajanus cajan TaxID=3821 RepID=UPI00098D978C|nr:histidine kinase CKI1 [Cajanus cajan]
MFIHMENHVNLNSRNIVSQLQSEIKHSAELLNPMKSSSTNLARFLNSTLDTTYISFSDIERKVAPSLFQAFETVPYLAEISYVGTEGLFFSYYTDHDRALAMYSNLSSSWGASNKTYIQPVNRETGEVYGEVLDIISNPFLNASWIEEGIDESNGFASLGTKWDNDDVLLFLSSARITSKGVISMGFSAKAISDFVTRIDQQGVRSYLATKDGNVLVQGFQHTHFVDFYNDTVFFKSLNANDDLTSNDATLSCKDEAATSSLNIWDTKYLVKCYTMDIMGIESVYVLAFPQKGFASFDLNYKKEGLILFVATMVTAFIALFSFLCITCKAMRRDMHLCASLIEKSEATQRAEKKNKNKSNALASASHDVRASLAGITGLIDISYELVVPGSELETNLKQMSSCTHDLLGLLNSILDTSKIESGKMPLEEEEFNVFLLLEDVVDFYYPVAMKKGVDIVLDPCDGSVMRYSRVKGDRGKLKQVLSNLLSNAVKFTNEGHIAVRAWTKKPRLQNSTVTCSQWSFKKYLSHLFRNKKEARGDMETLHSVREEPRFMDFIFDVDDTGKGIPKENYKSVFEDYVQVKETALGQGGTGLGLGIVQSLVCLMHGDIEIIEKDTGEKGTCFRFNVLLTCENETMIDGSTMDDIECGSRDKIQAQEQTMHATSSSFRACSMSPRLHIFSSSPKPEPSLVVLFIIDKERLRTLQRFMERIGIKVKVVNSEQDLLDTLKKIKQKHQYSDESSDLSSQSTSHNSPVISTRVPLSSMDVIENMPLVFKKTDIGATPGFILIVIDSLAPQFVELYKIVSSFKREFCNTCKVVLLDKPFARNTNFNVIDQNDIVISKPFHGSRLFHTIKLLPEFGGECQLSSTKGKRKITSERNSLRTCEDSSMSKYRSPTNNGSTFQSGEQIWKGSRLKEIRSHVYQGEIQECGDSSGCKKPLSGKKFLVAEDSDLLRKLASVTLISLGATIEQCENGQQAVQLVREALSRNFSNPPYDYILMDCQMPVVDGLEATKEIRKMEKRYGVHIPIIALTACTEKMAVETGIDYHIVKPIKRELLLEAIKCIHANTS